MFRMFIGIFMVASVITMTFSAIPFDNSTPNTAFAVIQDGEVSQSSAIIQD